MNSQTLGTPRITIYGALFPWGRWSVFKGRKTPTPSSISNMRLIDGVPPLSANESLRFIRIIYMGQTHKSNISSRRRWSGTTHPLMCHGSPSNHGLQPSRPRYTNIYLSISQDPTTSKLTWNPATQNRTKSYPSVMEIWIKIITSTTVNDYMNCRWMDICIFNF